MTATLFSRVVVGVDGSPAGIRRPRSGAPPARRRRRARRGRRLPGSGSPSTPAWKRRGRHQIDAEAEATARAGPRGACRGAGRQRLCRARPRHRASARESAGDRRHGDRGGFALAQPCRRDRPRQRRRPAPAPRAGGVLVGRATGERAFPASRCCSHGRLGTVGAGGRRGPRARRAVRRRDQRHRRGRRKGVDTVGIRLEPLEWDRRPPVEALLAHVDEADLLVVGSRGLHGFGALGSASERVAHRAPCSVLVVHGVTPISSRSREAEKAKVDHRAPSRAKI